MPAMIWRQPEVSWDRSGQDVSQSAIKAVDQSASATLKLSKEWDKVITVDILPRENSDLVRGVDYVISDRVVVFHPGDTEKTVTVTMLKGAGFRETKDLQVVAKERTSKGAKGEYSLWTWTLYSTGEPPTATFAKATQAGDDSNTYTVNLTLSEASREQTNIRMTLGGSLTKDTHYTITGDYWSNPGNIVQIPAGKTTAQLDVDLLGTPGDVSLTMDLPADNVRRNLLTFTAYGPPETGVEAGTESQHIKGEKLDDGSWKYGSPTDWVLGCYGPVQPESQWTLTTTSQNLTLPTGQNGRAYWYAPHDNDGGVTGYGCLRKSYGLGLIGGYDYGGTIGDIGGGVLRNVRYPDAGIRAGHNIWSVYLKNDTAPAGYTQAPYSQLTLINRSKQANASDDPNPQNHDIVIQWTAGVPSMASTDEVDYWGIDSVGDGWYRCWVIYDAPSEADGDTANWFVRPCHHPTDSVLLHMDAGCFVWGAQFETDPTRTQVEPSAYQHVEEQAWWADHATQGSIVTTTITGS